MASVEIAVRTIDQTTSALKSMQSAWQSVATPLNQTLEIFKKVGAAIDTVVQTIKDAAQVQATANTFDHLSASIGATSDTMLRSLRPATQGMVSDLELMRASNQFLAMGLATTEGEAGKLAQIGSTLGLAFRGDAAAGMEEFALLLANQSIPRLDTFGISAGAVRSRIAELQAEMPGMSRETAFMTATMEQAEITLGKVGDQSETAAGQLAQIETNIANVKNESKAAISEGLLPLLEVLSDISDVASDFGVGIDWSKILPQVGFGPGFELVTILSEVNVVLTAIRDNPWYVWFNRGLSGVGDVVEDTRWQIERFNNELETGPLYSTGRPVGLDNFNDEIERGGRLIPRFGDSMNRMGDDYEGLEPPISNATAAIGNQIEAVTQLWQGFEKLNPSITSGFVEAMELSDGKLTSFQEATADADTFILNLATSMGATTEELSYLTIATGDYTDAQITAGLKMIEFETRLEAIKQKFADGQISVYQMRDAVRDLINEMNGLQDKTVTVTVNTVENGRVVTNNTTNSGGLSEFDNPVGGATGGLVRGGTIARDSVPALLMPGERVLDREQNKQFESGMMGGGSGMTFNIYLANPTAANARQIASMTAQEVGRRLGRG